MTREEAGTEVKIKVSEEPAWKRVIDVEVPAEQMASAYEDAIKEYKKKAKVPGFRVGKVPRSIIEQRFGAEMEREVLQKSISQSLRQAYQAHNLRPITEPQLSNVEAKKGEGLKYRAVVEVRPVIDATGYKGLVLKKNIRSVTVEHVDQTIERIREQRALHVATEEPAQRDDLVVCDLQETTEDQPESKRRLMKDVTLVLNPERVFKEFADGLMGVKSGQSRNISLAYPDTYENKELAGRNVDYLAKVKEVKVRKLPEMDEEFLKSLSGDVKNLDDLKSRVRADLESQTEQESIQEVNREIVTQLLDKNPFDLPSSLLNDYMSRLKEDLSKNQSEEPSEELEARYKEMGLRQVRWEFLYHAIADKEKVAVTEEEMTAWLTQYAQSRGVEIEDAKKQLAGTSHVSRVMDNILENKVLSFLRDKSTITETPAEGNLIVTPGGIEKP